MPGQVDALVFAEHAAVNDIAGDIVSKHLMHAQFDKAVGRAGCANPALRFSARVLKVVPTSEAVPGTSRGVMVMRPPALEQHRLVIFQQGGADLWSL